MFDFINNFGVPLQIVCFIALLGIGTLFLVKFCDFFVDSACVIAKKLHVSPLIIGLTIVAMGTSCPELAVSTSDSIATLIDGGNANVALGNVVGSNICNILLVLGLCSIFSPVAVKKSIVKRELPILLGVSALLVVFGCFFGIDGSAYAITRWEAIIFFILIIAYLTYVVLSAKREKALDLGDGSAPEDKGEEPEIKDMSLVKAILVCVVGIAGIILGGEMVVSGAKGLAMHGAIAAGIDHDLTEALVGLTIVAVGTSLPELVTSVIAAKKGQNDLALGNVVGSNIFNILFILGIAGTVNPLTTGSQIVIDLIVMMVATVILFVMSLNHRLERWNGIIFISLYVAYLSYLVIRTVIS
ncbi:MAG: calcium/sodium antiporter [Clostridia bacterium]|nr:calcium/sodium antiporter [Clostridia bacterium]